MGKDGSLTGQSVRGLSRFKTPAKVLAQDIRAPKGLASYSPNRMFEVARIEVDSYAE